MERLKVSGLKAGAPLTRPLFHASGEMLLGTAKVLTADIVRVLAEAGIEEVFRPRPGEDSGKFIHHAKNSEMSVDDLRVGQRMTQPVFDRHGALLVEVGTVVTEHMASSMKRRGIDKIYVRRGTKELRLGQVQAFRRALRGMKGSRPAPIEEQVDTSRCVKVEECTPRGIDAMIDSGVEMAVSRTGTPFRDELKHHDPLAARSADAKDGFLAMYEQAIAKTEAIFLAFQTGKEVDEERIGELAREVVGGLLEDRDLLLNLSNMKTDYNYLLGHSLGVTVLSTAVTTALGYDRKQVLEMGYAAYLHDIGMLRVSPEIVGKRGKLTQLEMAQVRQHPVHSLDMLQRLVGRRSGVPWFIPILAYQTHEREDGSGYPKGRKKRIIHDFAKVLAVCDAYEAMTSRRPWREALLPYYAMERLIKTASRKVMSSKVVGALLRCISLFPIGSWVELSGGAVARVVVSAERDYTRPVVSVMFRGGQPVETPERVDLSERKDLDVVRPVPASEESMELMEGF